MIGSHNYVYHWLRLQSIGITHISFRPWLNYIIYDHGLWLWSKWSFVSRGYPTGVDVFFDVTLLGYFFLNFLKRPILVHRIYSCVCFVLTISWSIFDPVNSLGSCAIINRKKEVIICRMRFLLSSNFLKGSIPVHCLTNI